jgi:GAF domain-containing protein
MFDIVHVGCFDRSVGEASDDLARAALQAIVDWLRKSYAVDRCTLRLEAPDDFYPVVVEARTGHARTLIGDTEISLRGQPVVRVLSEDRAQVVQHDSRTAFEEPEFHRMLDSYGGLGAQIVTPVHVDGRLAGILSLHHLGGARRWSEAEAALARDAARLVAAVLASGVREAGRGVER